MTEDDLVSSERVTLKDHSFEFLYRQKDYIIEHWLAEMEMEYPKFYNLLELKKQGSIYFQMILDIEIPVEQHPIMEKLAHWCKLLFAKNIPIDHTLHSSHIFRESVIKSFQLSKFDGVVLSRLLSILSSRIDTYEREVCKYYWLNARSVIEAKDKKLDEVHEDKMNLIGKMAASMAHEIRNPLTSIKGFIKLIRNSLPHESFEKVEKYVEIIENEFDNILMQISGFLSFSKKPVFDEPLVCLSIADIMESVLLLINPRLTDENIELSVKVNNELMIYVQKVAIQQVLSNLLNNSIDALREIEGNKKIEIKSQEDDLNIYLMVTNNGPEIPKEIQEKLFEPFVTSKLDGTGIGLAICDQIMKKNNGNIAFESSSGSTTFILIFEKPNSASISTSKVSE